MKALLQARKLVSPPNLASVLLELESYVVADKKWAKSMKIELHKDNNAFAEGGFIWAFLATDVRNTSKWFIKEYKMMQMDPVFAELKMTADQHTRKQVQMHSVATMVATRVGTNSTISVYFYPLPPLPPIQC